MTLKIAQSSTPEAGGYWRWSVWLEGSAGELDKVEEVTWKLHPTFSEPIQRVKSRRTQFKLSTSGWGEFEVHADVLRADGKKVRLRHWLRLEQAKAGPPSSRSKAFEAAEPPSKPRPRTVFLSYTRENAKLAGSVAKQLRNDEIDTVLDVDIPAGENFARWMTEKISACDAFVFFGGEEASAWQSTEIEVAKRAGVALVPVIFAGASQTIPDLKKFRAIQIKDKDGDAESIAPEIARRIQERIP